MKSGPALAPATRKPRRRRRRSSPAVTRVLPLPEAGAARISPRPREGLSRDLDPVIHSAYRAASGCVTPKPEATVMLAPGQRVGAALPWWVKILLKMVLARLPVP